MFVHRKITVHFSSGMGQTGEAGVSNTKLEGLRVSAKITKAGDDAQGHCTLSIYGMTLAMMNELSIIGYQVNALTKHTVLVEAGDEKNGMNVVFQGTVSAAWPDMQGMPQVAFRVEASSGTFDAVKPAEPNSYAGAVPASRVAQDIAKKMGRKFENNGVNAVLMNPYYKGTLWTQMQQLAKAARFSWVDDDEKTIAIWPQNGSRKGGNLLISKDTGLVADPDAAEAGILVKMEYSQPVIFGQLAEVKCILTRANGIWRVSQINYSLESETPKGDWFANLMLLKPGTGDTAPPSQ